MKDRTEERALEVLHEWFFGNVANMAKALRNPELLEGDMREAIEDVLLYDKAETLIELLRSHYQAESRLPNCLICNTNHGRTDTYPGDNPCCPRCGHYNAMLTGFQTGTKCRDCGFIDRGRCPECKGLMVLGSSGANCLECRDCGLEVKLAARGLGRNSLGWETV